MRSRPWRLPLVLVALALGVTSGHAGAPPDGGAAPPPPPAAPSPPVLQVVNGKEVAVEAAAALASGLTIVDLSDGWTPFIFAEQPGDNGEVLTARYRRIFLGLANDTGDDDGQPIAPGSHNYLEVYGIPPTLSVLRTRFLADGLEQCANVDLEKIRAVKSVPSFEGKKLDKELARIADLERRARSGKASIGDGAALDAAHAQRAAFAEVEKRLACEKLFTKSPRHAAGRFDEAMQQALLKFQLKNKLYDSPALRPDTMKALGRTLLEEDYESLLRVLTERVISAASILEDGSSTHEFTNAKGEKEKVRDLVSESLAATVEQLGIATPAAALAFFQRHAASELLTLHAAVKLPARPEYYAPDMKLTVEIDRGDVIYDPPFDAQGKPSPYSRHIFPSFTLRTTYRGQVIPLVKWRTTIGGWRSEQAKNGYEYFRYKGSDVGPRVWRNVVAGPVWIAPVSTPLRTLVKSKTVGPEFTHKKHEKHDQKDELVVNYDELGPGYWSAYGLIVAYNVEPGHDGKPDGDNGVRVHGSSEYRSIRNPEGYSHGCHRLMNHLAERMFSFVLQHRNMHADGEKKLGFTRQFLWKEDVYELRLPTRGFWYTLDPPLPVNVLEGNILGKVKKPIVPYVEKPGVKYPPGPPPAPPDTPEGRAGGDE